MNGQLKEGLSWSIISHSPRYGDDDVDMLVDQGCTRKYLMKHSPSAAEANAGQLHPTIDPHKEHSRTERHRTVFDGYEEVPNKSKGVSIDHEGKKREDERTGVSLRARHRDVLDVDVKYVDPSAQVLLNAVALVKLPPRTFYQIDGADVTGPHRTKDVTDPWRFAGLAERKIVAHLEWQREAGVCRVVTSTDKDAGDEAEAAAPEPAYWPAEELTPGEPPPALPDPFAGLDDKARKERKRERLKEDLVTIPMSKKLMRAEGEWTSDPAVSSWVDRMGDGLVTAAMVPTGGRGAELFQHKKRAWIVKADRGWHEHEVSRFQLAFRSAHPDAEYRRGSPTDADEDLLIVWRGATMLAEIDAGTEGKTKFTGKFPKLIASGHALLIGVSCKGGGNEKRLETLREWCAEEPEIAAKAFLCDVDVFYADPLGFVWRRPGRGGFCRPLPEDPGRESPAEPA